MKKIVIILTVVGAVVAAYFVGHSLGRTSGFEDGVVYAGQSADMCKGMRAMALLGVLEEKNYTRAEEALNHDLDYAILGALRADAHLADIRLPHKVLQQEEYVRKAFKQTEADENTGYRHFTEFRRKHPTKSTNEHIIEAIDGLLKEY